MTAFGEMAKTCLCNCSKVPEILILSSSESETLLMQKKSCSRYGCSDAKKGQNIRVPKKQVRFSSICSITSLFIFVVYVFIIA